METVEKRLFQAMSGLTQIVMRKQSFEPLSKGAYTMLLLIRESAKAMRQDGVMISYLSEMLEVSKPAVSRMINSLTEQGFVEKTARDNDKRCVLVSLTEKGAETLSRCDEVILEWMNEIVEALGEDTEEYIRMCRKISKYYEQKRQRENQLGEAI